VEKEEKLCLSSLHGTIDRNVVTLHDRDDEEFPVIVTSLSRINRIGLEALSISYYAREIADKAANAVAFGNAIFRGQIFFYALVFIAKHNPGFQTE